MHMQVKAELHLLSARIYPGCHYEDAGLNTAPRKNHMSPGTIEGVHIHALLTHDCKSDERIRRGNDLLP